MPTINRPKAGPVVSTAMAPAATAGVTVTSLAHLTPGPGLVNARGRVHFVSGVSKGYPIQKIKIADGASVLTVVGNTVIGGGLKLDSVVLIKNISIRRAYGGGPGLEGYYEVANPTSVVGSVKRRRSCGYVSSVTVLEGEHEDLPEVELTLQNMPEVEQITEEKMDVVVEIKVESCGHFEAGEGNEKDRREVRTTEGHCIYFWESHAKMELRPGNSLILVPLTVKKWHGNVRMDVEFCYGG